MNKKVRSNHYKIKEFIKKWYKLIKFLIFLLLILHSILISPPQNILFDFSTKKSGIKINDLTDTHYNHSFLNTSPSSVNHNYQNTHIEQNNSLIPWAINNLTLSKSLRYKEKAEFIINQTDQDEKRISFPLTRYEQIKINTSTLYYPQMDLIDNNSIDWRTPLSSTSSIIQKNPSSVVLSYYDEGFFPQVVYRYWPHYNLKQDLISYISNITVRGDPNTDTGAPKVSTVYFVVETNSGIFFFYYILYSELPVSANSTYDFRFLINASLGESIHINFSFPNSLISLGSNETYRLLDIVYSFTPGLSIEFSKPILLYRKMVRPTELKINTLVSNYSMSLYYSNSTLLIRPTQELNFTINFPNNSDGKLAITADWLVDTLINISIIDKIKISFNLCLLNYSSQIPYYYNEINVTLPFTAKYSISSPNNEYLIENKFIIIKNNIINNKLKNNGVLTLISQYNSYFLSSVMINHNVNKTLDFSFLKSQGINFVNDSLLTIYNGSHIYYLRIDPSRDILSSNNIPSLLDHGYVWGVYIIFNENTSFLYFFQITIVTYQTILFLNNTDKNNTLIGYRWLNITIMATYLTKYRLQPVIDTEWFLTIYTHERNYYINPIIKIFKNTTYLIFSIKGWLNPGKYNVSLSTKSTLFQNKFLLFNLILKDINPTVAIIKTMPNSIFLITKNNNATPIPNATLYIVNVPSSYNFTNNSGIAEIKLFATPPKIIRIKIIFHDFETIKSINLKEISSFYKPKIFVEKTQIVANHTSKVLFRITIPPLFDEWNLFIPNNYSLLTIKNVNPSNASGLVFYQNSTFIKLKGDGKMHFIDILTIIASPKIKKISSEPKIGTIYGINISVSNSEVFVPVPKSSKFVTLSFLNRTISYTKINETLSTIWIKVFAKKTGMYYLKTNNIINSSNSNNNPSLKIVSGLGIIIMAIIAFLYIYKKRFKKSIIFDFDL